MAGVLHFLALILTVAIGAAWIFRAFEPPNGGRIIAAFTLGPALAVAAGFLAIHECALGQPIQQWVIPGLVMSGVLCCTVHSRAKAVVLVLLFALAAGLSVHYATLVHGPDWIGVEKGANEAGDIRVGQRRWHTRLTGLYQRTKSPMKKPGPPPPP